MFDIASAIAGETSITPATNVPIPAAAALSQHATGSSTASYQNGSNKEQDTRPLLLAAAFVILALLFLWLGAPSILRV